MWLVSCLRFPSFSFSDFPLSRCNASVLDETEEHLDFVMGEVSISLNNAARKAVS